MIRVHSAVAMVGGVALMLALVMTAWAGSKDGTFQWVERRPGETPRTHLIFQAVVGAPIEAGEVLITSPTPDSQTVAQTHGHQFRNGHLYITRHDGQQFQPGLYTLRVQGTTAAGASVDFTATVPVELAAGETLSPSALPSGVTGTNGQPVH